MPTAAPPTTPFLRLNTETHTAPIRRIDVDRAGTRLLTVSHDKTARLWSLPDARLIRVFRPPIGEGDEGKLYAGALSPDGRIVAVGGWTGKAWDGANSVYLFDAESGAMTGRLGGLPNVILHLAFSRDGMRLAAGLWGANGIRVWAVPEGDELFADGDYDAAVYGLTFATDGRLAATSEDGFLRLYAPDLKPVWKRRGGGTDPNGIAFSPDGARLAVGYYDVKRVELWASAEGVLATPPDVAGGDDGNMGAVAWSADGRFLFAGGRWGKNGKWFIRRWAGGGNGPSKDLPLTADSTVMDLKPLGSSGLLFGAADPAFGGLDEAGREVFVRPPALVDMRGKLGEALSVSADGLRLRFGLGNGGERPVLFDLSARALTDAPTPAGDLSPARVAGLPVIAWKDEYAPKLADRPLALSPYEFSRSLAISPAGDRFVLGAEWRLRLFDSSGNQLWGHPVPGVAWGVVVTGDGRMVVAACDDGTLRWFRLSDGAELLALFVHPADRRWVVWTPGGYYLASPGAEELIGFHVNRGADQAADFFPASTFRDRLNRPDVVARVLETLDEGEAVRLADLMIGRSIRRDPTPVDEFPPIVRIEAPQDGAAIPPGPLRVTWAVESPSGLPVVAVRVRCDGRPARILREGEGWAEIDPPATDARSMTLSVYAESALGAGPAESVFLLCRAPRAKRPNLRVLAVGVRHYANPAFDLTYPAKDARDFVHVMERQWGPFYDDVEARILTDREATRASVLDGMDWLRDNTTETDLAVLFLAGHGADLIQRESRDYYFLAHDADPARLRVTAVPKEEILRTARDVAGKLLICLDTCHSGDAARRAPGQRIASPDLEALINEFSAADMGAHVLMACSGTQYAEERDELRNGVFTSALVAGLRGAAANEGGAVTVKGLADFARERVADVTEGAQTPCHAGPKASDFPIALVVSD